MTIKSETSPFEEDSVFGTLVRELDDNQKGSINAVRAVKRLNPNYLVSEYTKFFLATLKTAFASNSGVSKAMIKHKAKGMFGEEWADMCIQYYVSISYYDGTALFDDHLDTLSEAHQKRKMIEESVERFLTAIELIANALDEIRVKYTDCDCDKRPEIAAPQPE